MSPKARAVFVSKTVHSRGDSVNDTAPRVRVEEEQEVLQRLNKTHPKMLIGQEEVLLLLFANSK